MIKTLKQWFRSQCRKFIFWAFSDRVKNFTYKMVVSDQEARFTRMDGDYLKRRMMSELVEEMYKEGFLEITERRDEKACNLQINVRLYCIK